MHETHSSNILLNLDKATKKDTIYTLNGWVASPLGKITEFWMANADKSKDIKLSPTFYSRPDVSDFYPEYKNNVDSLGFEFNLDRGSISVGLVAVLEDGTDHYIGSLHKPIIQKSGFMKTTHKDLIVVDDFYSDPDSVREYVINNLQFQTSKYHKGHRSTEKFILDGTKEKFEEIIGRKIYNWMHPSYANGIFQFCTADQPIVYHIDTQMLAAMVYLTPDAPVSTGTAMYKSKINGLRCFPGDTRNSKEYGEVFKGISDNYNFYDSTQFEMVDTIGNIYNRLVIFNSSNIHAATEYFGDAIHNSRLFHLFFFDVE